MGWSIYQVVSCLKKSNERWCMSMGMGIYMGIFGLGRLDGQLLIYEEVLRGHISPVWIFLQPAPRILVDSPDGRGVRMPDG